jgi:hypothetical protein
MMFSEVIHLVQAAFLPADAELSLAQHAVAHPAESHVDSFGSFLFHGIVGDARGSAVVGLEGRWWLLGMAELFEGDANGAGFFAIAWKRAASSASAALETTLRMIWQRTLTAPFEGGGGWFGSDALVGSSGKPLTSRLGFATLLKILIIPFAHLNLKLVENLIIGSCGHSTCIAPKYTKCQD